MLTLQLPMLLALLGTALMAVVIFAPQRVAHVGRVTASFAPPGSPPVIERWRPDVVGHVDSHPPSWLEIADASAVAETVPVAPAEERPPAWPALVDPCAADCDARARLALADALAVVRAPWSESILRCALDDEPDPAVRAALVLALAATA